ncbi:MAG: LexA family protein [Bacteriovoracia bacterium]
MRVAGFPSPADEYGLVSLSLNELLVPRPTSTFFVRVVEDLAPNIKRQDILVVDRSLKARSGTLALVVIAGQLCLRRIEQRGSELWLCSLRTGPALRLREDDDSLLWGVVTYVIHQTHG